MGTQVPLPYTDNKPIGAADFYFAINATFRFVLEKYGLEGLRQYWSDLGKNYFAPVSENWKAGSTPAIGEYWKAFFAAEPAAVVEVTSDNDTVTLDVRCCPAIKHLREHKREILPSFCQHCYFVSEAMAEPAGFSVRVEGGNGSCRQFFLKRTQAHSPQDLGRIKEATC